MNKNVERFEIDDTRETQLNSNILIVRFDHIVNNRYNAS